MAVESLQPESNQLDLTVIQVVPPPSGEHRFAAANLSAADIRKLSTEELERRITQALSANDEVLRAVAAMSAELDQRLGIPAQVDVSLLGRSRTAADAEGEALSFSSVPSPLVQSPCPRILGFCPISCSSAYERALLLHNCFALDVIIDPALFSKTALSTSNFLHTSPKSIESLGSDHALSRIMLTS